MVDRFHAIRFANHALDDLRARTQRTSLGHRGRRGDPLYPIRRRPLDRYESLRADSFARVLGWLEAGDPAGEVGAAYLDKELLRRLFATRYVFVARRHLVAFYNHCADAEVPELTRTIDRWEGPMLRWHRTGLTIGRAAT